MLFNFFVCLLINIREEHTDKYYSKNLNLGPEGLPVDKKSVGSTVFHAIFNASGADTARICYLK